MRDVLVTFQQENFIMNKRLLEATSASLVLAGVAFLFGWSFVGSALIGVFILLFTATGMSSE